MQLFLDSDILLDAVLFRAPFHLPAMKLLSLAAKIDYKLCTSVHSILNVYYFASKQSGKDQGRQATKLLIKKLKIIQEDQEILEQAFDSDFGDIEDAVQYFAAKKQHVDFIITRNIKDYKNSSIEVLSAEHFLKTI